MLEVGLYVTHLLCCVQGLVCETGHNDGVHVQLLPQLLIVRQLCWDISLPLDRNRSRGRGRWGGLIKALNPGTMNT